MSIETSFATCEEIVKRSDPDRYYSALFAPAEKRPLLFALYAFNHEIARVAESVREPMLGEIRLQWWREAVESARDGNPRAHDVVRALAEVFASVGPPMELFEAMIEARSLDAANETFASIEALEAYADATSGNLMRVAARTLGADISDLARDTGIAYALTGILRAIPFHASRGKLYLPLDMIVEADLSADEIIAGQGGAGLKMIVGKIAAHAAQRLEAARALSRSRRVLPALLPATLVPGYLKLVTKPDFDPFRDLAELPLWRRQLAMMVASVRGRI
ncbi:MAG TPA: phytoene/squalene synthase family protein [Rhizomicrobium sp.]|nr:phytoene/squalene synthase family protein [Rhizomicrobium sp.]